MFAEFDHVLIADTGVTGDIVDVQFMEDGSTIYLVESDQEGPSDDPTAWNLPYPIFTCTADQLVHL